MRCEEVYRCWLPRTPSRLLSLPSFRIQEVHWQTEVALSIRSIKPEQLSFLESRGQSKGLKTMATGTLSDAGFRGGLQAGSLPTSAFSQSRTSTQPSRQPDLLILKLMQKLSDADPLIRRNAAGALRLLGARAVMALAALAALLADQDVRVRNEAERAIDHLKQMAA